MFDLQNPDPKTMQINLTGFLQGKNAREFLRELWELLLSAQENIGGIPSVFLEKKKEEIKQRKVMIHKTLVKHLQCTSCLVIIIHSNLSKMKNKILPICLQGNYRDSLGGFNNNYVRVYLC